MRISIDADDHNVIFFTKMSKEVASYDLTELNLNKLTFAYSDVLTFDMDINAQNKTATLYLSLDKIPSPEDFKKIVRFINYTINTFMGIYPQVKTILELHREQMNKILCKFDKRIVDDLNMDGIQSFVTDNLQTISKWLAVKKLDQVDQEHLKTYLLKGIDLEAISQINCGPSLLVNQSWRYRSFEQPIPNSILKPAGKSGTHILRMQEKWISTIPNPYTKNLVAAAKSTTECIKTIFVGWG